MRPLPQFLTLSAILLALTAFPAWKLLSKFDVRLKAYEQQKRVDLKREPLEELQRQLQLAHEEVLAAIPVSATAAAVDWEATSLGVISPFAGRGSGTLKLSFIDAQGRILSALVLDRDRDAKSRRYDIETPTSREPPFLTRAIGNAIRGLKGFSLSPYLDAQRGEVYGAWLWDREHQFGMVLEVPATTVEDQVRQETARFQKGRRFLYFLCIASYLMVLMAIARVTQRLIFKGKS